MRGLPAFRPSGVLTLAAALVLLPAISGAQRYVDSTSGFSLRPPAGWKQGPRRGAPPLPSYLGPTEHNYQVNLLIESGPVGKTLDSWIKDARRGIGGGIKP